MAPGRRTRNKKAQEPVVESPPQQEEDQDSSELEEIASPEPEEADNDEDAPSLKFDEELTWRPARPIAVGTLISRLEKLSEELADYDQEGVNLESLSEVSAALAHRNLLQHKDKGVRAYTACCLVDILRLHVPEAPFTADQLKLIFTLFIGSIIPALFDPTNPWKTQNKHVLTSLTEVKSLLLLNEVPGGDDLTVRLFNTTFDGVENSAKAKAGEQLPKDVVTHLTEALILLIDEAPGSVPPAMIDSVLTQFLRALPPGGSRNKEHSQNQATLLPKSEPPAYTIAKNICNGCPDKLARYVSQYFGDVILSASRFATAPNGHKHDGDSDDGEPAGDSGPSDDDIKNLERAHILIRELWRAAPSILSNVVQQVEAELSADNLHLRQVATETIGDMIAGVGAAGLPPSPIRDAAVHPPVRLMDEPATTYAPNALTTPQSPFSFIQTHHSAYRSFVGRRFDKSASIRAIWVTAVGRILSTSAGGLGLNPVEEKELLQTLHAKLSDSEEKVRLAAVKAVELLGFRDIVLKLGAFGGVDGDETSILATLADRIRDKKVAVRVEATILLAKLWAVGAGEIADGQEAVTACLEGVPNKIISAFYANDLEVNLLLDRVLFECLIPLKYPQVKNKHGSSASSDKKVALPTAEQDALRAERILLMLKSLNPSSMKAFWAMQVRQTQFAVAVAAYIKHCEAYNGGVSEGDATNVKKLLGQAIDWMAQQFPDAVKVRGDLQKFAKMNDRRAYQLLKFAVESESDFQKVRRSIHELISKIQGGSAGTIAETLLAILYRASSLMFNRSHLTTIMDTSKDENNKLAATAHAVLNELSARNPALFKAHSAELRTSIVEQAPSATKSNDPGVMDMLKAYSSYAKQYPEEVEVDKAFTQTLMNYALYGRPHKSAKYAVNLILSKDDDKGRVTATNLVKKAAKGLDFGTPNFLNKLQTLCHLQRLVPEVTADEDENIDRVAVKDVLRQVRKPAEEDDASWVNDPDMDEEIQAKSLAMKLLVNRALATADDEGAETRGKALLKLLMVFVVEEGEFCKSKNTPLHHKKRLRLLAGQCVLKMCRVKKYDDQLDPANFNKLAELVQDSELQARRRFMEKLQKYLQADSLRPRFYTMLFIAAFEPVADVRIKVETWLRARALYYADNKRTVMEAMIGRLIPLLAHHPDYSPALEDLLDFSKYILFYLDTVARENNISHIYKYAERVKQTRDILSPDDSDSLYTISDLAQTLIRKFQERRNWSFQAWPDKVGLPAGLYVPLPSSEVAHEIATKQYIPEELDERLDDLLKSLERKKKRKSATDSSDRPSGKKAKSQISTVIREKSSTKAKPKSSSSKPKKKKTTSTTPSKAERPTIPLSERRRSGRAAAPTTSYKEADEEDDDAEMGDGSDAASDEESGSGSDAEESGLD
ncbi:putative SPO76 protein [Emericellopsis atlantica]|uniref:SPO76 protein n=1 Tax=Emericellopsis atlantica TaxID=2614577 RepID=A0A9P7ZMN3_9HYPO|nr:putative SPO76 protein [Emericellopsis atlantica]KAG9254933.1 putative SPO76 protein [Emericellopsis atlantica]